MFSSFRLHTSYFAHLAFLVFSAALHAAPPKEALLIANGKYSHFAGLANPGPDALKLGATLEGLGFRVRVVRDGNREQMIDAIAEFERGLRNTGAIAFFHYGGHGVQVDGKNYLLPADADIPDERRVATRAVALDEVMTAMDAAAARASIIVIDACRDNPLPAGSGRNLGRGLSVVGMKPKNSMVIYAAEAGSKALDGLFTPILASSLQQKGRSINQIMMSVRSEVYTKSSGQQTPGEYNQLFEELFLGELAPEKVFAATSAPTPPRLTKEGMVFVEGGTLPGASELSGKGVKSFFIGRTEVTWLEWKQVRSWASDHGYDIGNIGKGTADNHPVQNVSWYDVLKWCNAKSQMEGLAPVYQLSGATYKSGQSVPTVNASASGYRLPVEVEWEWAARGGASSQNYTYSGSNDINLVGWYSVNYAGGTKAVGSKNANEIGLYDMSGNLAEWCFDAPGSLTSERSVRGGSFYYNETYSRCAYRGKINADYRGTDYGFRIARNAIGDLVTIQGGTLPQSSALAGQPVQAFQIGRSETTWGEWKTVRTWAVANGYSDLATVGNGTADNHPVQMINWYDAVKWCNAKSEMEGLTPVYQISGATYKTGQSLATANSTANGYRLPYRAEWDWAARGGVKSRGYKYSGSDDLNAVGWFRGSSGEVTHAVGQKQPNELGLYDMSGNIYEWSWTSNNGFRGLEGGSYGHEDEFCRVAYRGQDQPAGLRGACLGLRLARNATTPDSISYAAPKPAPIARDEMVLVEAGTLPDASELAGKSVKSFYIGRTEVTWLEWKKVRNWAAEHGYDIGNVGEGSGNDHPVRDVSWYDCVKWCNARSEMEGLEPAYQVKGKVYRSGEYGKDGASLVTQGAGVGGYRLASEVEWEWAARGGVKSRSYKYSGSDDLNAVGWYRENSKGAEVDLGSVVLQKFPDHYKTWTAEQKQALAGLGTFPVAKLRRNELDLSDISGNVWEWCGDLNGTLPRLRGSCWSGKKSDCAVSYSYSNYPYFRVPDGGFRLARNLLNRN